MTTSSTGSQLKSVKSRHGFYDEFSVIPTQSSGKIRGSSKPLQERILTRIKPAKGQTCTEKYANECKKSCTKQCWFHLFPILLWLPSYNLSWFKKDIMAGITVSILLVPQSLAYATLAGLPPEWGLYASVMPIFLYAMFSTSTQVAVGPVAPTAIMVASAVTTIIGTMDISESDEDYDELYQTIAMTLSFVCGFVLIIFGLIRAGFIIVFLSRPVMTGFIMSAAFIILINQFRALLGLDIGRSPLFYQTLIDIFSNLDTIHGWTTLISCVALFLLYLPKIFTKIPRWVPIPLIVIVLFILISYFADLESVGVETIGGGDSEIEPGFPVPKPPDFSYFGDVFAGAIVVAIVSYMGSIALAKGFEQKTKETYKQQLAEYNEYCNTHHDTLMDSNAEDKVVEIELGAIKHDNDENNDEADTPRRDSSSHKKTMNKQASKDPVKSSSDLKNTDSPSPDPESPPVSAPLLNNEEGHDHEIIHSQHSDDDDELKGKDDEKVTNDSNDSKEEEKEKMPSKPISLPPIALSANMEFIAYGIANLIGSFFSSQVISASFSRSALNFEMNGYTQMSSIIQAIICLLCLLFLLPLLSPLPKCVLAAVVTVSVHRLIKNGVVECRFLWRVSRIELIEFLVAFISPLIIGLEIGIFLSIGCSIVVNLLRHSFAGMSFLGRLTSTMSDDCEYVDCAVFKQAKPIPHLTIIELKAELAFYNNNRLIDKIRSLLEGGNRYIVVSLNLTSFIDATVIRQIVTIFEDCKGAYVALSQCRPKVMELMQRYSKETKEFPENVKTFVSTHDAVRYLITMKRRHSTGFTDDEDDGDSDLYDIEESLSSLQMHGHNVAPQVRGSSVSSFVKMPPRKNSGTMSRKMSPMDVARRNTFSFRSPRHTNTSHTHSADEPLASESEDDEDEDEDDTPVAKQIDDKKQENDKIAVKKWESEESKQKESTMSPLNLPLIANNDEDVFDKMAPLETIDDEKESNVATKTNNNTKDV